jgi:hypothetical protein
MKLLGLISMAVIASASTQSCPNLETELLRVSDKALSGSVPDCRDLTKSLRIMGTMQKYQCPAVDYDILKDVHRRYCNDSNKKT